MRGGSVVRVDGVKRLVPDWVSAEREAIAALSHVSIVQHTKLFFRNI